ncbi:MAG: hypothetical protein AAFO74_00730 [Pseudomonadota bacterium]
MFRFLNLALTKVQTVIQIAACLLIGMMMVFAVGLPLFSGGRYEGLLMIVLGSLAFLTAAKRTRDLFT